MRFRAAIGVGIVAVGLGLLACTDATEVNHNPPKAPIQVLKWESGELPKPAASEAGPPPGIPCDAREPPGKKVDSGVEAAPVEDPYAG